MFEQIKAIARTLKRELKVYRLVLKHPHTPKVAKVLLAVAVDMPCCPSI
jgi:hypothetical protein